MGPIASKFLKVVKWSLLSLLTLVLLIVIALGVVLMKPSVLINDKTLALAPRFLRKSGMDIQWKAAHVTADSQSLKNKSFTFAFEGLCADLEAASGCFDKLALAFDVELGMPVKLFTAGPVEILGGDVLVKKTQPKPPNSDEQNKSSGSFDRFINLSQMKVQTLKVELKRWRYEMAEETLQGSFNFASANETSGLGHWIGVFETEKSRLVQSARAKFDFENTKKDGTGSWKAQVEAKAVLARKGKTPQTEADANVHLTQLAVGKFDFDYRVKAHYAQKPREVHAKVDGSYRLDEIKAHLNSIVHSGIPSAPKLVIRNCNLDLKRVSQSETSPGRLLLDCPVTADIILPSLKDAPNLDLPQSTGGKLTADLKTSYPPSASKLIDGKVGLVFDPILTPLFEGGGHVEAVLSGVPAEFPEKFKVNTDLAFKIAVPDFKKIVQKFQKTKWAVPAPINVMAGRIEFGAKGKADLQGGKFPLYLTTRLASAHEKMNIDANGEFALVKSGTAKEPVYDEDVTVDVVLSDISMALPRLNLEKPPKLMADRRIEDEQKTKKAAVAAEKSHLKYKVTIRTPERKPLHILSNLADAPIPIFISTKMTESQSMTGSVSVGKFPLKLFRRDAKLESFVMEFPSAKDEPATVDGAIQVAYTDYVIRILIYGTSDKPQVKMVSEPPLAEDQLVAVLLFGRPLQELEPTQGESVGNAKAAMADGAVGLASLYVLASTPIESLGYDPESREVSAKVKLGEGTSLNLGTSAAGSEHIGVRRRLSKHWTVTTDFANGSSGSSATEQNGLSAFLEWSSRY
ncbi:MAG: translocation/assembly module TamB domain-containing protein [Methylotenera sp.]|nr:translocation/assembly module TamB domain-containing protein [Oligoflexia bacterium]